MDSYLEYLNVRFIKKFDYFYLYSSTIAPDYGILKNIKKLQFIEKGKNFFQFIE